MKCLLKSEDKVGYDYTDIDVPVPGEGELLVKILKVSLCGSDIVLYKWDDIGKSIAKLPFIPGHECVGEIVKVGTNCLPEHTIGERVCCENHYFCGKCYQCLHDEQNICQHLNQYGHGKGTMHGGFSQFSIIPSRYAYLLKTSLDAESACLLEAVGVAHQGVEKLSPNNDTVLVQGCGPIGLYSIAICKHFGAKKIIATDIIPDRLDLAKQMGAHVTINSKLEKLYERVMSETDNDGVGCLLEASGAQPLVNNCFKMLRKGGTVVLIGIPKSPIHIENAAWDFVFKSLTLHTIHGRKIFHSWEECEKLLYEKVIDVSPTITHRFPMSQYQQAFDALISGIGCKIVVDPQV